MKDCYSHCSGSGVETNPVDYTSEHETVKSRLTGRNHEISFGPLPAAANPVNGGQLPANPYKSLAQERYMHANPEVLGKAALKEWDASTKGKHLPEKVKK